MEKKGQPLICVGYFEDMKAYMLFDLISISVIFKRVVYFDEHFNLIISPNLAIDWLVDDGEDCIGIFVFIEQKLMEILSLQIILLAIKINKWKICMKLQIR